jgi:hypothetical protein
VAHFDLDEKRLERVINSGAELTGNVVERLDISLLALSRMPDSFAYQSLFERIAGETGGEETPASLRAYLTRKYVTSREPDPEPAAALPRRRAATGG